MVGAQDGKGTNVALTNALSGRRPSQIEADMSATRDRLTSAVQTLVAQVHPAAIKQRTVAQVKHFAQVETENAKSLVFNARGDLRTERLAAVGGGVAGFATFLTVVRTLVKRRKRRRASSGTDA